MWLKVSLHFYIYLEVFVKRKLRGSFSEKQIAKLQNKNFVIISNNCFGGQAYRSLQLPYNTPFVGLFLYGPCYLKLLQNFGFYLNQDLIQISWLWEIRVTITAACLELRFKMMLNLFLTKISSKCMVIYLRTFNRWNILLF